ncbi:MAG TPA: hypothetical protein ENK05_00570, partial [Gammaproteobacteria bacterium]|nr:hypothetical protein [Gammaproteobacteria bacterium]
MNASLPVPVMTAASSAAAAALSENSSPEQSDSGVLMDFRALLQEAGGGAGGTPATNTGDGVETALSPQPLQDGGKLLPLLRQLLDGAAARGLDPQAVLDRLEARLQTLDNETDLDPSALIAVALQQVLDEMPPASPGGTLRQATAADVVAVADTSGNARTLKQLAGDMESGADARQGDRNSPVTEGSRPPLPDKPSVETPLAMAGQRPAEVADLLASLRRLAGGAKTPALDGTQSKTDTAGMQMPQHLPAPAANPSSTPSLLSVAVPVQQAGWDEA